MKNEYKRISDLLVKYEDLTKFEKENELNGGD